jgi:hypothetical protein
MTIAGGLSATKTGTELINSVRELLKRPQVDPGEISARLLELQDLMLDARIALSEAQEEKTRLENQIAELSRMAEFGKQFKSAYGVYWHEFYPYCPTCWDVDRKPVRLAGPSREPSGGPFENWTCPFHKVSFKLRWNVRSEMKKDAAAAGPSGA